MLSTIRSAVAATSTARGPNAATVIVGAGGNWRRRNPSTRSPAKMRRSACAASPSRSAAPSRDRPCHRATTSLDVPSATLTRLPVVQATVVVAIATCTGDRTVTANGPMHGSIAPVAATIAAAITGASSLAISPIHTSG